MGMVHSSITPVKEWQFASTTDTTDTTAVPMVAAVAGMRHRVLGFTASNSDATVSTIVQIRTGTTVIGTVFLENFVTAAPGGGTCIPVIFPMPLIGAINSDINFICETTSAQVRVMAQGVTEITAG